MDIRKIKTVFLVLLLTGVLLMPLFSKSESNDEMNFQIGVGGLISTSNLLGLIESVKLYNAMVNNETYNYPGLTPAQQAALKSINGSMARAIMIANILGAMEYGVSARFLWNILISEVDLDLLPLDGSYNGRLDLMLSPMIGIRSPWFIQLYAMVGVPFTFSFYPNNITIESWKIRWAATDHFAFNIGIIARLGLDLKFKSFSIGGYYQYTVKDFQEFIGWYNAFRDIGVSPGEAAGKIFAAQSRFGVALSYYFNFGGNNK